jgi:kexin
MRFRLGASASAAILFAVGCTGGGGGGGGNKPAIPLNVAAMVAGTDIQLSWTASAGATSYNVYYALDPGVVRSNATELGSVGTAGAIVPGQPSAIGYFAITAKNGNGESALSAEVTASVPSAGLDPLFTDQWHLTNTGQAGGTITEDAHVAGAWASNFDGTGVRIAIVDDGLEIGHEDLFWNCPPGESFNYLDGSTDPTGGEHGTACAGVAAAVGANTLGGRGAAFEAHLVGYNFLESQTLSHQSNSMTRDAAANWISNNSWGPDDIGVPIPSNSTWRTAVATGLANGRNGLGIVYMKAAGNGAQLGLDPGDNSNLDGFANFYGMVTVGAVGDDGKKAFYSENGANVFVCAPSMGRANHAITTVDRTGVDGYNDGSHPSDYVDTNYTNTFNGTSSATPLAAGVVALMLQANPNLTWRDVRLVLAQSARLNDPTDPDWTTNGAGYSINHQYGFGCVDANAAVTLAQGWTNIGPMVTFTTPTSAPNLAIPDADLIGVSDAIVVAGSGIANLEFVEIVFDAAHPFIGDLEVTLTAPSGTASILTEPHDLSQGSLPFNNFHFGDVRHLDEPADGTWTLTVRDLSAQDTGTFQSWSLIFRGR